MKRSAIFSCLALSAFLMTALTAQDWPKRVLITNDNGIEDPKIVALARAFSKAAQTYVAAPKEDRSGTGSFMSIVRTGQLRTEERSLGEGITAYAVDGYPADCVIFGLARLMAEDPPDLVVSGINGGPNLGIEWFGSGTVGAARMAALAGFPAIAVSGLDDDIPGAVEAAVDWVVRFSSSEWVRSLPKGRYLTVSIPRLPPSEIQGIAVAQRSSIGPQLFFEKGESSSDSSSTLWTLRLGVPKEPFSPQSDIGIYQSNRIAVVPMTVDENDSLLLSQLQKRLSDLPAWKPEK